MIEVENLLAEVKVVDDKGTAWPNAQGILVVCKGATLSGGQDRRTIFRYLVKLATFSPVHLLIMDCHGFSSLRGRLFERFLSHGANSGVLNFLGRGLRARRALARAGMIKPPGRAASRSRSATTRRPAWTPLGLPRLRQVPSASDRWRSPPGDWHQGVRRLHRGQAGPPMI